MENKNTSGRFGINVEKWCKAHTAEAEALISAETVSEKDLRRHGKMLSYLMHERLIHLIVLVMTVFGELFLIGVTIFAESAFPLSMIMMYAVLVVLIFYVRHYFILENTVQNWYRLEEEMTKILERRDS